MDKNRLLYLLEKYGHNSCTQEELEELQQWYHSLDTGQQAIEPEGAKTETFSDEMLLEFKKRLAAEKKTVPIHRKSFFRVVAAAAAIILLLGSGTYFLFFNRTPTVLPVAKTEQLKDLTPPASNKAILTLGDGTKIDLDAAKNGALAIQGNINIEKLSDGKIAYTGKATEVSYNTLVNPRGSKVVNLTLGDGTRVWLNAESSLTYPTAFVGSERKVVITGEAYFEVSKDATRKFFVSANDVTTEVMGTQFNLNNYSDERRIKVTLVEGSVKIRKNNAFTMLIPGQQAEVNADGQIILNRGVNIDEVMAWKNGRFDFNGADIRTIMRQVARWYNVEVIYKDEIGYSFVADISRDVPVSELLNLLELTNLVHFKIEANRIIVMK